MSRAYYDVQVCIEMDSEEAIEGIEESLAPEELVDIALRWIDENNSVQDYDRVWTHLQEQLSVEDSINIAVDWLKNVDVAQADTETLQNAIKCFNQLCVIYNNIITERNN